MKNIYLIDDDHFFNQNIKTFLEKNGFFVKSFFNGEDALDSLLNYVPDLIITDLRLPGMDGIHLLKEIKNKYDKLPVILITNYSDIRSAIEAIKTGAFEYLSKPFMPDELLELATKAITTSQKSENKEINPITFDVPIVKGKNSKMIEVWKFIDEISTSNLSVFISGESGVGKEYVAKYIHSKSGRFDQAFVIVDCSMLSDNNIDQKLFGMHDSNEIKKSNQLGLLEKANGGTIFFDEITNLSTNSQAKILRAIQNKKIEVNQTQIDLNIRFIASTSKNINDSIEKGNLKKELFFRLNEFPVHILPLRQRSEDIVEFIDYFSEIYGKKFNKKLRLSIDLINDFKTYDWPGNLWELKNLIKRGAFLSKDGVISHDYLPNFRSIVDERKESNSNLLKNKSGEFEKQIIQDSLLRNKYNKTKVAKELGITRSTLYKKIRDYDLE